MDQPQAQTIHSSECSEDLNDPTQILNQESINRQDTEDKSAL